jgi:hypothetical protein
MPTNHYQTPGTEKSRSNKTVRFTLRELFLSVTLIAIGLGGITLLFGLEAVKVNRELHGLVGLVVFFASPACIAAGVLGPVTGRYAYCAGIAVLIWVLIFAIIYGGTGHP